MCCQCNSSGRCVNCSCTKSGSSCVDCLPLCKGHCGNSGCGFVTALNSSPTVHPPAPLHDTTTPPILSPNDVDQVHTIVENIDAGEVSQTFLPNFTKVAEPSFMWGTPDGPEIVKQIDEAYDIVICWKHNVFHTPFGRVGKTLSQKWCTSFRVMLRLPHWRALLWRHWWWCRPSYCGNLTLAAKLVIIHNTSVDG